MEENLLVAKNKLGQSGTKNHKFFVSKQVRRGNMLVLVEGEGEKRQALFFTLLNQCQPIVCVISDFLYLKSVAVSNLLNTEEVTDIVRKKLRDPGPDPSRYKLVMATGTSEPFLPFPLFLLPFQPDSFFFSFLSTGEQALSPTDRPYELHFQAIRKGDVSRVSFILKDRLAQPVKGKPAVSLVKQPALVKIQAQYSLKSSLKLASVCLSTTL